MHEDTVNLKPHRLVASDRVEGTRVYNADGKKIGAIKRLMIDKTSAMSLTPCYASVAFSGSARIIARFRGEA